MPSTLNTFLFCIFAFALLLQPTRGQNELDDFDPFSPKNQAPQPVYAAAAPANKLVQPDVVDSAVRARPKGKVEDVDAKIRELYNQQKAAAQQPQQVVTKPLSESSQAAYDAIQKLRASSAYTAVQQQQPGPDNYAPGPAAFGSAYRPVSNFGAPQAPQPKVYVMPKELAELWDGKDEPEAPEEKEDAFGEVIADDVNGRLIQPVTEIALKKLAGCAATRQNLLCRMLQTGLKIGKETFGVQDVAAPANCDAVFCLEAKIDMEKWLGKDKNGMPFNIILRGSIAKDGQIVASIKFPEDCIVDTEHTLMTLLRRKSFKTLTRLHLAPPNLKLTDLIFSMNPWGFRISGEVLYSPQFKTPFDIFLGKSEAKLIPQFVMDIKIPDNVIWAVFENLFTKKLADHMKIMETNGLEMLVASSDVSLSEYPDELNWLGKGVDTIDQGFSLKLMTRFNPSHPNALIQMLAAHLGPFKTRFAIQGVSKFKFGMTLTNFYVNKYVQFLNTGFSIAADTSDLHPTFKISVKSGVLLQVSYQQSIQFHGKIAVELPSIETSLDLYLEEWKAPFGFQNLKFFNLRARVGIVPNPPYINSFAVGGGLELGRMDDNPIFQAQVQVGINLENPKDNYYFAQVGPVSLVGLMTLFNVDPARIAMMPAALIETEFPEGMTLSWSLSDVTLPFKKNQVSIPAGFQFKGKMNVLGFKAAAAILIDPTSLKFDVLMNCDPINLGPLHIVHSLKQPTAGPHFEMKGSFMESPTLKLNISGYMAIGVLPGTQSVQNPLGINIFAGGVDIILNGDKFHFNSVVKLLGVLEAQMKVHADYKSIKSLSMGYHVQLNTVAITEHLIQSLKNVHRLITEQYIAHCGEECPDSQRCKEDRQMEGLFYANKLNDVLEKTIQWSEPTFNHDFRNTKQGWSLEPEDPEVVGSADAGSGSSDQSPLLPRGKQSALELDSSFELHSETETEAELESLSGFWAMGPYDNLDKPTQPKECGKAYRMLDALSYSSARSALYAMSSFISNFELDIELQGDLSTHGAKATSYVYLRFMNKYYFKFSQEVALDIDMIKTLTTGIYQRIASKFSKSIKGLPTAKAA